MKLSEFREYLGYTTAEVSSLLGVSKAELLKIENAPALATQGTMERLSSIYGLADSKELEDDNIAQPTEKVDPVLGRQMKNLSEETALEIRTFSSFIQKYSPLGG